MKKSLDIVLVTLSKLKVSANARTNSSAAVPISIKMIVFDCHDLQKGDYTEVQISDCTSATLMGDVIGKGSIAEFSRETIAA